MARIITVKAMVEWKAGPGSQPGRWIARCEPLGLAMEGESLDEVYSLIPETMHLLMIDLLEEDELSQFLRERGWDAEIEGDHEQDVQVNFPWHLVAAGGNGFEHSTH